MPRKAKNHRAKNIAHARKFRHSQRLEVAATILVSEPSESEVEVLEENGITSPSSRVHDEECLWTLEDGVSHVVESDEQLWMDDFGESKSDEASDSSEVPRSSDGEEDDQLESRLQKGVEHNVQLFEDWTQSMGERSESVFKQVMEPRTHLETI